MNEFNPSKRQRNERGVLGFRLAWTEASALVPKGGNQGGAAGGKDRFGKAYGRVASLRPASRTATSGEEAGLL